MMKEIETSKILVTCDIWLDDSESSVRCIDGLTDVRSFHARLRSFARLGPVCSNFAFVEKRVLFQPLDRIASPSSRLSIMKISTGQKNSKSKKREPLRDVKNSVVDRVISGGSHKKEFVHESETVSNRRNVSRRVDFWVFLITQLLILSELFSLG
jgi:hypothetical protein